MTHGVFKTWVFILRKKTGREMMVLRLKFIQHFNKSDLLVMYFPTRLSIPQDRDIVCNLHCYNSSNGNNARHIVLDSLTMKNNSWKRTLIWHMLYSIYCALNVLLALKKVVSQREEKKTCIKKWAAGKKDVQCQRHMGQNPGNLLLSQDRVKGKTIMGECLFCLLI